MSDGRKAVCIIGWPAGHSRSPLIHNYWIAKHGLNAEYRKEPTPPEKLPHFVRDLRDHGYIGANITVPHKEVVMTLSTPDERARAIGAANTLWYEDVTLRSTNTDVIGFLENLDHATPGWDPGQAHDRARWHSECGRGDRARVELERTRAHAMR